MFHYKQLHNQLNPEALFFPFSFFFAVSNARIAFKAVIKVRLDGILNAL